MDLTVLNVYKTFDYGKFQFMKGNREINENNLRELEKSVKIKQYIIPIVVNEYFQIINGQHRYTVFKKLRLPIYYIKIKGLALSDCQKLNSIGKHWIPDDYLSSYCSLGYREYLLFKEFREDFSFITMRVAQLMLSANRGTYNIATLFKEGKFRTKHYSISRDTAEKMKDFADFEPFLLSHFQTALYETIENVNYDHKKMISKAIMQKRKLTKELTTEDYKKSLSEIYNYKSRSREHIIF